MAVNRQLAAEAESGKAEAEAAVRAEYAAAVERLSAELEQLRSGRKETEELLAQVGIMGVGQDRRSRVCVCEGTWGGSGGSWLG